MVSLFSSQPIKLMTILNPKIFFFNSASKNVETSCKNKLKKNTGKKATKMYGNSSD